MLGIRALDECIGRTYAVGQAVAVPLPHPSGVSRWLNEPANRARVEEAVRELRTELRRARGA
jgi:hypothetical protein